MNDRTGVRRVAVTGATGFIGRHLVDRLASAGVDVRALCRSGGEASLADGVTVVEGSLEDAASLARLVEDVDVIVHCAGCVRARGAAEFDRVNREGSGRLAAICADRATPPRFVHVSSVAARSPEVSEYAASKRASEVAVSEHSGNMHWVIVRPPAVYGSRDRATLQLFKLLRGGVLPVPSRRRTRVSLIYVADLCEALNCLVFSDAGDGGTHEIRDTRPDGYCWQDIADAGARAFGRQVICIPIPRVVMNMVALANQAICGITRSTPGITRGKVREIYHGDWVCRENDLTRCTNWRPNMSVYGGFERAISWYSENNLL